MSERAKVYLVFGQFVDETWVQAAFSDRATAEECERTLQAGERLTHYGVHEYELDPPRERWADDPFGGPQEGAS